MLFGFGKKTKGEETTSYKLRHILGLDIPENVVCEVKLSSNKLRIEACSKEYNLNIEKISSVDFELEVNVEKYKKSSSLKSVAGAVAFGAVGAIVGAIPNNKEKRLVKVSAVISYRSATNEIAYIILEDMEANSFDAADFVDRIRPLIKSNGISEKIEL